ncbi:hypothetical protein MMC13_002729 [Lambiella insularis]|nr:hypothetical protein [Lambiella insularis]
MRLLPLLATLSLTSALALPGATVDSLALSQRDAPAAVAAPAAPAAAPPVDAAGKPKHPHLAAMKAGIKQTCDATTCWVNDHPEAKKFIGNAGQGLVNVATGIAADHMNQGANQVHSAVNKKMSGSLNKKKPHKRTVGAVCLMARETGDLRARRACTALTRRAVFARR